MANLRRNHVSQGKGLQSTFRVVIFLIIAFFILAGGLLYLKDAKTNTTNSENYTPIITFLPSAKGQVIYHKYYTLSYLNEYELSEWVAYVLTKEELKKPNVNRYDRFEDDEAVDGGSSTYHDYSGSGFTRGHLAPAGDMAFNQIAMQESFYMSNITPQLRAFNNGVWKELEETVRDWAAKDEKLYIITGPIIDNPSFIGKKNHVAIPSAFFKVILDYEGDEKKAIAFVIPNALSDQPLQSYAIPVDKVEAITGIDFFNNMINDKEEELLESSLNVDLWKFSDKRFQLRVSRWNKE